MCIPIVYLFLLSLANVNKLVNNAKCIMLNDACINDAKMSISSFGEVFQAMQNRRYICFIMFLALPSFLKTEKYN